MFFYIITWMSSSSVMCLFSFTINNIPLLINKLIAHDKQATAAFWGGDRCTIPII